MVDSETLGVELVVHAEEAANVVDEVARVLELRTSLDRSNGHVQEVTLVGQLNLLPVINHGLVLILAVFWVHHATKDHDALAVDLDRASMDHSQLAVVGDIVDGLPSISVDVERFHCIHVSESKLVAYSGLRLQALASNDEDVPVVELAGAEALSGLLEVGQHNPLLGDDVEVLAGVQTLNEWLPSGLVVSVSHSAENVDVILEFVNHVLSSWIEHAVKRAEDGSVLIEEVSVVEELLLVVVKSA